ncbi:MAG: hypothetical protein IPI31_10850 [Bacteroidetes bacterium]|nr:hypothetical protein [Bacteroidota bacterium]
MINILIAEDNQLHYNAIVRILMNKIPKHVQIYPEIKPIDNKFNYNEMVELLQIKKFAEVTNSYDNIDLFIIDASLKDDRDEIGLEYFKYLKSLPAEKGKHFIIVSGTDEYMDKADEFHVPFISKMRHGVDESFGVEILAKIKEIFQLDLESTANNDNIFDSFKSYVDNYGIKYALHKSWLYITTKIERRIVDKVILLFFYTTLTFATIFATYNILLDIFHISFYTKLNETKDTNEIIGIAPVQKTLILERTENSTLKDTMILEYVEHIFLNILPIFIIFSFYTYYKTNGRIILLDGNSKLIDHDSSTRAMNVSKILFVSSIFAYVTIKTIEKVVTNQISTLSQMFPYAIILIILVVYYHILKKNH